MSRKKQEALIRPRISPESKALALELLKEGRTYQEIAETIGVHRSSVGRLAQNNGIVRSPGYRKDLPFRKPRKQETSPRIPRSKLRAQVLRLREMGMRNQAIAAELNTTKQWVSKLLQPYTKNKNPQT